MLALTEDARIFLGSRKQAGCERGKSGCSSKALAEKMTTVDGFRVHRNGYLGKRVLEVNQQRSHGE
jgi:hypothetical protein